MGNGQRSSRREFLRTSLTSIAVVTACGLKSTAQVDQGTKLRLGGPVFEKCQGPEQWVEALKKLGYRAAYCPVGPEASDDIVKSYEQAAGKADIVISEVGAWSNPISSDESTRKAALEECRRGLDLADRIGARCCVNITGSRGQGNRMKSVIGLSHQF